MTGAPRSGSPPRTWGAVRFRVAEGVGEVLLARLGRNALGAEVRSAGPGACDLVIYLESPAAAARAADWIRTELEGQPAASVRVTSVADEGWVELYQASLVPFPLGQRFTVYPRGRIEGQPPPDRIPLLIEPGRAFGTGEHPTTQLCIEALERTVEPQSRWVDLGCGTGILALVARHVGARHVLALDLDPEAVAVARAVVAANRVLAVDVVVGGVAEAGSNHDGVAVNILAPFFLAEARRLAALVRRGGSVVASGFLATQVGEVRQALSRAGLEEVSRAVLGDWAALTLRAAGGGPS